MHYLKSSPLKVKNAFYVRIIGFLFLFEHATFHLRL